LIVSPDAALLLYKAWTTPLLHDSPHSTKECFHLAGQLGSPKRQLSGGVQAHFFSKRLKGLMSSFLTILSSFLPYFGFFDLFHVQISQYSDCSSY